MLHSLPTSSKKLPALLTSRWAALVLLLLAGTAAMLVRGAGSAPTIPAINLSADPLYAATGGDKPAMALALSVEFPTVGAQYLNGSGNSTDGTYANTNEYLGYYDAESCYTYNNAPTETPATGLAVADYKRFDRSGAATARKCSNAFSGNFLNWASNSAIDMLRLSLSGGDRYIDTATLTVLQRAVIPNGNPTCMWNSGNFPAKQLTRNGGGAGTFWGAVPTVMVTAAGTNDIWIANTLNRIYFGTSNTGGCGNTGAYVLGGSTAQSMGTVVYQNAALPGDATVCAGENGSCAFSGTKEVWYGANNTWEVAPVSNGVACTNTVFGDPIPGTVKNCYARTYTGAWTPPANTSNLNTDGFFYSRVSVCNSSSGNLIDVRDYGLCKQYPNGNFKPTGAIQKYSDSLRLSAFGYVMDQTQSAQNGRYGGVLRAPMKYVGSKTFDTNGTDNTATGGNPNAEWDSSTGVFYTNPDGDTTQTPNISGVINYLNKFGRTGSVAGRYKTFDPVGELHYEALRYLQGLQPSPAATANLTTDMYDGFPLFTSWTDPYGNSRSNTADYSCVKSNIVVVGDINTWDGGRFPTPSVANNIVDINAWRTVVQNFETNTSSSYTDGQGATRTTGNPNGANGNVPNSTDRSQIMGSAYWAHTHDIRGTGWTGSTSQQRPGLRVKTYLFDVNENGSSNNASFRQYQNQFFMAAKYGGFEADAANIGGKPYNLFGNPFQQQNGTNSNDVWQDPSNPGDASAYYLQSSARQVLAAFDSIFNRASSAARSIAGAAVQSKNLTTAGSAIYQASFDTSDWSGDVVSTPVSVTTTGTVTLGTTNNWSASDQLNAMATPATNRNIVVGKVGATSNPTATAFTWAAIETGLQTNLAKLTPSTVADTKGQDRLNYLRGDHSNEGTGKPFRIRTKLLGDIINSGVVYSGTPTTSIGYSSSYASFYTANASRGGTVFVGANDGMLHAFNASTGYETFAYIPSWMGPKLAALTATTYPNNHQSYVDGTPVVAEAQTGTSGTAADWKTVLVAGTGNGGSGVFALDVTTPSSFSASKVMWEFTRADDADMGYVVGHPQIVRMRTSAVGATPTYRWFAAVASGVNNYVTDSAGQFSTTGNPALFLLALDKPAGTAWSANTNYYKLSVPIDSTLSISNATGLINFRTILGLAREVTQIYMGDLHGKVWRLNFSLYGIADWNFNKLSTYKTTATNPIPLYIAQDASSPPKVQPITMAPSVLAGPTIAGVQTNYVAFATGKFLEFSDRSTTNTNSVYAVYEDGSVTADSSSPVSLIKGRSRLQLGTVNTTTDVVAVPAFKWGRSTTDGDLTQRSGWYFEFPNTGEREIFDAVGFADTFLFNSLIPPAGSTTGSCTAAGGSGYNYSVNIDTGNGTRKVSTVGLLGGLTLFDSPSTTQLIKKSNSAGQRLVQISKTQVQTGSTGITTAGTITTNMITGRLSWRQINNYQDMHLAP